MKRKVCVVVASRANYGRIKSTMQAARDHPDLELQLIVGASALLYKYGSAIDVIRKDGFEPRAVVYMIVEGENPTTMAKSTGLGLMELPTLFEQLEPDVVLTVADRFETMATAIAATYMNLPLAHTQGGEVTGSIDESVRHAITKLAHVHFPATQLSAERLVRMGEDPAKIFVTGCPSLDLLGQADLELHDDLLDKYHSGTGPQLDLSQDYLLVLQHPVTTEYGQGREQIEATLEAVQRVGIPTLMMWPNVDAGSDDVAKGIRMFREHGRPDNVNFYRNFAPEDYYRLMKNCRCMVGNSSSAIREGAFMGVPAVNVGTRQQGRERGRNVMDVGYDADAIVGAVRRQVDHGPYEPDHLYGDGHAGGRIADVLASVELTVQKRLMY